MYKLTSNISIDKYKFIGVVSLEINSGWDNFTDTCTITVPGKTEFEGKSISSLIKRGMKVTIELGYDDENELIFSGFVRTVKADVPIEILCEDNMYLLKQNNISKTYPAKTPLKTILNDISIGFKFNATEVNLGKLRINNTSSALVLDELKNDYGLVAYFKGETLYVGIPYWADTTKEHFFSFQKNIIENNLSYMLKDDIEYKVVAVSIDTNNEKIEVSEPENGTGDQRTFYFYDVTEADLKTLAKNELEKLRFDGYRGTFTTFGKPTVRHGDIVNIKDEKYNRIGKYLVKSVVTTFGIDGYRQEIELDRNT